MKLRFWCFAVVILLSLSLVPESRNVKYRSKRGVWGSIKKGWGRTKQWFSDTFGSGNDDESEQNDVVEFFKNSLDSAKEDIGDFLGDLKDTMEDAVELLEKEIKEQWSKIGPEIKENLKEMMSDMKEYGSKIYKRLKDNPECVGECALSLLTCISVCGATEEPVSCVTCLIYRVKNICIGCLKNPQNGTLIMRDPRCRY